MIRLLTYALCSFLSLLLLQIEITSAQDMSIEDYCKIRLGSTSIPPFSLKNGQKTAISLFTEESEFSIGALSELGIKVKPGNIDKLHRLYQFDSLINHQALTLNCFKDYYKTLFIQLKQDYYRQLILHYEKMREQETDSLNNSRYELLRQDFINQRTGLNQALAASILNLALPSIYYENKLKPNLTSEFVTTDKKHDLKAALIQVESLHPSLKRLELLIKLSSSLKENALVFEYLKNLKFEEKEKLKLLVRKKHEKMESSHQALLNLDYKYYSESAEFIDFLELSLDYNNARLDFFHAAQLGVFESSNN